MSQRFVKCKLPFDYELTNQILIETIPLGHRYYVRHNAKISYTNICHVTTNELDRSMFCILLCKSNKLYKLL